MSAWCDCGHPTISAHRRKDCPHTPFSKDSGGCNLGDPTVVLASAGQPPDVSAAYIAEGEALDALRRGLLVQMSEWSEENWCAGWMGRTEEMLYEQGGTWEIVGRQIGWPTGYEHDAWFSWVTWDEAGRIFEERKAARAAAAR